MGGRNKVQVQCALYGVVTRLLSHVTSDVLKMLGRVRSSPATNPKLGATQSPYAYRDLQQLEP